MRRHLSSAAASACAELKAATTVAPKKSAPVTLVSKNQAPLLENYSLFFSDPVKLGRGMAGFELFLAKEKERKGSSLFE